MLVTSAGDVWAAGWNSSGQLGLGRGEDCVCLSKVPRLPAVTQVACGWNHTLALSKSGEVYFWGSNSFGQLGMPDRPSIVDTPQLLEKKIE
jgi:alpha-tubulin suppressor-like RCC1 family protein